MFVLPFKNDPNFKKSILVVGKCGIILYSDFPIEEGGWDWLNCA